MATKIARGKKANLHVAKDILRKLEFGERQSNQMAALVLLALVDLRPNQTWSQAAAPLCGITPIIAFIGKNYGVQYAPNTRETIRDEAVKFFADAGLLVRNPDQPSRPTTSANTVYQIEPVALELLKCYGQASWPLKLIKYLAQRSTIRAEIKRQRALARIPVTLPDGRKVSLSGGGQNPLIKAVVKEFCPRFTPGGFVLYIGDTESKFRHLEVKHFASLGVILDAAAKMPDVVVHDRRRNWLILVEAVASGGPIDAKRRKELKSLFANSTAGLVFVTAFVTKRAAQRFLPQISWETEIWIAEAPEHLIHLNGERFLGPYSDVMPKRV